MPRKINWRRAHGKRCYSTTELADTLGVHPNTISQWRKKGLQPIDGRRPALFYGADVQDFGARIDDRRKVKTPPGMIYCAPCRNAQRPAKGKVDYVPRSMSAGFLIGVCPDCARPLRRPVSNNNLPNVSNGLAVRQTGGESRLTDGADAPVNCVFK